MTVFYIVPGFNLRYEISDIFHETMMQTNFQQLVVLISTCIALKIVIFYKHL